MKPSFFAIKPLFTFYLQGLNRKTLHILLVFIFSFSAIPAFSQPGGFLVKGKVTDASTGRPLAFVNIAAKGTRYGCTTDIDGRFSLKTPVAPDVLLLSYLGYQPKDHRIDDPDKFQVIVLDSRPLNLDEVKVRPGINPAHRIIDSVMVNRKVNDPEQLNSFTYDSYNKFFATAYTSNENKPELSIDDTVDFERLKSGADPSFADSGISRKAGQPVHWKPDSATIVSFLHDTALVHPFIRNVLADTVQRVKLQLALQFLKDNPWYLDDSDILSDSSGISRQLFSDITSSIGDLSNTESFLDLADTLLHTTAVLNVLVPAVDSLFSDSTMTNTFFATTGIDSLMKMKSRSDGSGDFDDEDFSLERQNLFLMESITQRQFRRPDLSRETVIATRTSGFQDPLFVLLATQIQSFSFYHDVIHIAKKNYINPISRGSTSKYFFHIEDTILYAGSPDTVFIISFQPRRHTKFDGLKGVLYINSDRWAIQNVIAGSARNDNVFSIKIQQQYRDIDHKQWFPDQLNTEVTINNEGVIDVDGGEENYVPIGIGRTYIKNVVLNPDLKKRNFDAVAVEVDQKATRRDSSFWNAYRAVSLTDKDRETYRFLDSLGREYHFDKYARSFFTWKSGYMPVKFMNINLGRLLLYNQYEGLRPELNLVTNHRLSQFFSLGGYVAYGTGDKRIKYGGSVSARLYNRWEPSLEISYKNDITAYGVEKIKADMTWFSDQYLRRFLLTEMTPVESVSAKFDFRAFKYQKWFISVNRYDYERLAPFDYNPEKLYSSTGNVFTEFSAGLRFAFREKLVKTMQQELLQSLNREPVKTKFPVLWMSYTHGLQNAQGGPLTYNRLDMRMEKSFFIKYLGTSTFILEAGAIDRNVPYVRLYNAPASYRQFTIEAPNSFGTMRMNEFVSDRYAYLFYNHNFGKLLIRTDHFQPEFNLITNIGFGNRRVPWQDVLPESVKTMKEGYYESGVMIRNLVNLKIVKIGLGVYYRYGPYSFESPKNNFAFKFSLGGPF